MRSRYISERIKNLLTAGAVLFLAMLILLINVFIAGISHFEVYASITVCVAGFAYIMAWIRLVIIPYRQILKTYDQFIVGHILDDLFEMEYSLSPGSEKTIARFNNMLKRSELVDSYKKEAEYLALQNQINPHFLYNTLEGIRSEAIIAGIDDIAEMTEALATFYRYTISRVEHLVTLEDELANIENYYYIQQFRFGDKLKLSIEYDHDDDISEIDILKFRLPKLTLQPIVENSIYHGIEPKVGNGHLRIRVIVLEEKIVIRISDDGMGMEDKKVMELNAKLGNLNIGKEKGNRERGCIAAMNVNNRIKLLFGEEYGIYFYSKLGAGTDVEINLPRVTG